MSSEVPGLNPQQALGIVQQAGAYLPIYFGVQEMLQSTRTFLSVMTAIVVFDHFATFHLEVRYLWNKRFSWVNYCALINRYGIIASLAIILYLFYLPNESPEYCKTMVPFMPLGPSVVSVFADLLLIVRVAALWERNRFVIGGMTALLALVFGLHVWIGIDISPLVLPTGIAPLGIPDIRGCIPGEGIRYYWLNFTMTTIFDFVALVLSVVPCLTRWRRSLAGQKSSIIKTLLRDGIFFFALCFCANLINIIYYTTLPPNSNQAFLASLSVSFQSISASRMIFNLREASVVKATSTSGLSAIGTQTTHISGLNGDTALNSNVPRDGMTHHFDSFNTPSIVTPYLPDPMDSTEKGELHEMEDQRKL